jgi:hypothetical protein
MHVKYSERSVGMSGNSQLKNTETIENMELYEQYIKQLLKFLRGLWKT